MTLSHDNPGKLIKILVLESGVLLSEVTENVEVALNEVVHRRWKYFEHLIVKT